jgi:BirA family transcriptional regulator, biotin operon repressor / biotin---[acetyl-CoA-carboxylase] ligase
MSTDLPPGFSVLRLDSIPSTNDYMLERVRQGTARAREVCVAREQPGARGRQGRRWIAEEGGLWFTVAMPLVGESVGWVGMLAALAVCHALDGLGLRAGVKWPNDVVLGERKLAGVLVETVAGRELLAVGVGLNVGNPLPEPEVRPELPARAWPPTSVRRETARDVAPEALLSPILARLDELWAIWAAGRVDGLRDAWNGRDVCRGRQVRLLPTGPEGVADGIDPSGALWVRLPNGRRQLAVAGELAFVG